MRSLTSCSQCSRQSLTQAHLKCKSELLLLAQCPNSNSSQMLATFSIISSRILQHSFHSQFLMELVVIYRHRGISSRLLLCKLWLDIDMYQFYLSHILLQCCFFILVEGGGEELYLCMTMLSALILNCISLASR
jgi:hypothetical protein